MKTLSLDTHPEVERVHIQLLSQAGPARRLALARSLSQSTIEMSRRAIGKRHPHLSSLEISLKFVQLCYGDDLAHRLKIYIEERETS